MPSEMIKKLKLQNNLANVQRCSKLFVFLNKFAPLLTPKALCTFMAGTALTFKCCIHFPNYLLSFMF